MYVGRIFGEEYVVTLSGLSAARADLRHRWHGACGVRLRRESADRQDMGSRTAGCV